jgi:cell division protein FtsB
MTRAILHKKSYRFKAITLILVLVNIYTLYHLFQGQRGIYALREASQVEQQTQHYLQELKSQRLALEDRVVRMRPGSIDPDLMEEQAMLMLGPRAHQFQFNDSDGS